MEPVNLNEKLSLVPEFWAPKVVARYNDNDVLVVRVKGSFVWHTHPDTDDFFHVLKGTLVIEMRDGAVRLGPGEVFVVPKGVEHRPVALDEAELLILEPEGTPNTGDAATAVTKEWI